MCVASAYHQCPTIESIQVSMVSKTRDTVLLNRAVPYQVILAGTLTGVQTNIRCKVLVALSKVK